MNKISAGPLIEAHGGVKTANMSRRSLILTAWLGTLLLSRLPQILLIEFGVISPTAWSLWWWMVMGTALFALTHVWAAVRPLRGYFLILTMIYGVTMGLSLLQGTSFWMTWFGPESSWLALFFGDRLGVILMGLSLAGILALRGQKPREFFLSVGDLEAPAAGMRLPWKLAGPLLTLVLTALFTAAIFSMNPSIVFDLARIIPLLAPIFLLALMNAFGEELVYRAAPLSQLWQVVGKRQAVWLMALWFGLGHYYGGVSFGPAGVVYLTLIAVLFGKAMVETKGIAMPVFMHLWGDVVLYIILALGST
jgi:membrane protease YdiL (CAAX protease family)